MFRLLQAGINVPVVPGIMPVTNASQIIRICQLSGTKLPPQFRAMVERFADKPAALKQAGIAYATGQIIDLISNGFNHVHIYTMNRPEIIGGIMANLSEIVKDSGLWNIIKKKHCAIYGRGLGTRPRRCWWTLSISSCATRCRLGTCCKSTASKWTRRA